MPRFSMKVGTLFLASLAAACATAPSSAPQDSAAPGTPGVSPADLVASLSEVASGKNPAMRDAGIALKSIELHLMLGTEEIVNGKLSVVILSAQAARRSEVSFTQTFLLEIPAAPERRATPGPLVPGVREFVEAAMETARDIAQAASAEGMPHRLKQVVLVAKLERSRKGAGGIAFTLPTAADITLGVGGERTSSEQNTIKLVFVAAP